MNGNFNNTLSVILALFNTHIKIVKTMKFKILLFTLLAFNISMITTAQTADEIIDNYFENTGGKANWEALSGTVTKAKVNQGGMEIPITIISTKNGQQLVKIELQGQEMVQFAFDGDKSWGVNFMTMKPEMLDSETNENMKRSMHDFPSPFLHYKENGYAVELMGKETVEGVECYKIKLTKKPQVINGEEVPDVEYYYFDTENFVPILMESEIKEGEMKGKISQAIFSDYQEVDGLYFPFSMTQGLKDGPSQTIEFLSIELNPDVNEADFEFPEVPAENAVQEEGK